MNIKEYLSFDIEIYKGYVCFAYKVLKTNQTIIFTNSVTETIKRPEATYHPLHHKDLHTKLLKSYRVIGFNLKGFDNIILSAFFKNYTVEQLYKLAHFIIDTTIPTYQILQKYDLKELDFEYNDLMPIHGSGGSLKLLGTRLCCPQLEELPYNPTRQITPNEWQNVMLYCIKDLDLNILLFNVLKGDIKLRDDLSLKYNMDLTSANSAGMAEKVMLHELKSKGITPSNSHFQTVREKIKDLDGLNNYEINLNFDRRDEFNYKIVTQKWKDYNIKCLVSYFKYKPVENIKFKSKYLNDVLETYRNMELEVEYWILEHDITDSTHLKTFVKFYKEQLEGKSGAGKLPFQDDLKKNKREFWKPLELYNRKYKIGGGGIHSENSKEVFDDVTEWDFSSYYPSIILNFGFYPKSFGDGFLKVYDSIYRDRFEAKKNNKIYKEQLKDGYDEKIAIILKDSTLIDKVYKLLLNSTFGRFNFKFSKLYSPTLMYSVTITGQLLLLMLIERLENEGIKVVSANTDSVTIQDHPKTKEIIDRYLVDVNLNTNGYLKLGATPYRSINYANVNNYVAITKSNFAILNGQYGKPHIGKNVTYPIVFKAIVDFIHTGKDIRETINECEDVREFLTGTVIKGGGVDFEGNPVGKVCRFYYSNLAIRHYYLEIKAKSLTRKDTKLLKTTKAKEILKVKNLGNPFKYILSGNSVPDTSGAISMLDLPQNNKIPKDLSKEFYVILAKKHLLECNGYYKDLVF